jgi:hypothetical protein
MRRMMTTTANILIGKSLKPDPLRSALNAAGVSLLPSGRAILRGSGLTLYCVKIVDKATGRRDRHLSRYLTGRDGLGTLYEIFLGVVKGTKNFLFKAR